MKRKLRNLVIIAIIIAMSVSIAMPVLAAQPITPRIRIDGEFVEIRGGQPPIIVDGRTLVPLRDVMEPLGFELEWIPATSHHDGEVLLTRPEWAHEQVSRTGLIRVGINSRTAIMRLVGEQFSNSVTLDVPPQLINARTMVPVRAISEMTGFVVEWNGTERIVEIYTDGRAATTATTVSASDEFYDVLERHADGTMTVRTNTGFEVRIYVGQDMDTQQRLDRRRASSIFLGLVTENVLGALWAGGIFNVTRVTTANVREQEVIEDLGNFLVPYAEFLYIYDLPDGRYRVTLIQAPEGFVHHDRIDLLTGGWLGFRAYGEQYPVAGIGMNNQNQPFSTKSVSSRYLPFAAQATFSAQHPPQ